MALIWNIVELTSRMLDRFEANEASYTLTGFDDELEKQQFVEDVLRDMCPEVTKMPGWMYDREVDRLMVNPEVLDVLSEIQYRLKDAQETSEDFKHGHMKAVGHKESDFL